jgi:hypothetical protein
MDRVGRELLLGWVSGSLETCRPVGGMCEVEPKFVKST